MISEFNDDNDSVTRLPQNVLILLTSHRSGSTWLSDAIRCHSAVEYYPEAILYEKLNIPKCRRYPGDLSSCLDGVYEIEVHKGKWEKIPRFDVSKDLKKELRNLQFELYSLEKVHPSFFEFETSKFLDGLELLEQEKINVKLVYLVRDPQSLITSFLNYQSRKPSWYKNLSGEDLIRFLIKTYEFIYTISKEKKGLIFDYSDLKTNMSQVLSQIYHQLWNKSFLKQKTYNQRVSKLAIKYTKRKKRLAMTVSPFLGLKEGLIKGSTGLAKQFCDEHQELLNECYILYEKLWRKS